MYVCLLFKVQCVEIFAEALTDQSGYKLSFGLNVFLIILAGRSDDVPVLFCLAWHASDLTFCLPLAVLSLRKPRHAFLVQNQACTAVN